MPFSAHLRILNAWTARLNGWQRLWIVLTVAWTMINLYYFWHNWQYRHLPGFSKLELIGEVLLSWLVPPIVVLAVGLVVRWVYRGFKPLSSERREQ